MSTNSKILSFKKKVSKSYETISVSYHESGHAICALLRCIKIKIVSIKQNERFQQMEGITEYFSYIHNIQNKELFNYYLNSEIYIYYSGLVSEKLFYKKISGSDKFPSFLKDGSSYDTKEAAKLITKYHLYSPGEQRFKYKRKVTKQIGLMLEDYWSDVELLSHFLFKKKRINYQQIKSLMIRKSINKQFWRRHFKKIDQLTSVLSYPLDSDKIKTILEL